VPKPVEHDSDRYEADANQGDSTRESFVAKSGMKRLIHRLDAKLAKPN
jgi:hypothetical protein